MSTGIFRVPGALRNWSLFPPLEAGEELMPDLRKGHGGDAAWLPSLGHKGDTVPDYFLTRSSSPLGPRCHDMRKPKRPHGKVAWRCSSLSPQVTRSQLIAATEWGSCRPFQPTALDLPLLMPSTVEMSCRHRALPRWQFMSKINLFMGWFVLETRELPILSHLKGMRTSFKPNSDDTSLFRSFPCSHLPQSESQSPHIT